jgi:type IV secretory pathway VirB2 component (pilin)
MPILRILAVLFIIAWLVMWLAIKVTFGAIHLLLLIGVVLLVVSLFGGARRNL